LLKHLVRLLALFMVLLAACRSAEDCTSINTVTLAPTLAPATTQEPFPISALNVTFIYPALDSELEMGTSTRLTVQILDAHGEAVVDASARLTVFDPERKVVARLPAFHGSMGIYRTDSWTLPHRVPGGTWRILGDSEARRVEGRCSSSFTVTESTSEILLADYGFWLAAPQLINADVQVGAERGDAHNGMIRWGGAVPGMHITAANYVEVHWRTGRHDLESAEDARRFLLEEIGDLGDLRTIGSGRPTQFKHWDAWELECRTYTWEETVWVIFYAPEVDKTYAIATILRLPPRVTNPHGRLRESFAVFSHIDGTGVAPVPLPHLLPGPELVSPALAARFRGAEQPVILQWQPLKRLEEEEYYRVTVDYTYREAWPVVHFATRETQFPLPETLYHSPNCGFFNWRVRLMRQTGVTDDGQPAGEPLSHPSLYWYLWWLHPPGQEDFPALCPYAHYD
jgi:hypothetical protein